MIIGIDFDGTLVDHDFPNIGKEVPHAFDYLKKFNNLNAKLILFTMRSDSKHYPNALKAAVNFIESKGITLYGVNKNPNQHWTTSPKVYCEIYIDDSAFGCPLINYKDFKRPCVDWSKVGPEIIRILQLSNKLNGLNYEN